MLKFLLKKKKTSKKKKSFGENKILPKKKKKKKKDISSNYISQSQPSEYSSVGFAKLLIIVRLYW